ncbi:hypothetical protein HX808_30135 [Pseudomonas gingeri]|nr:hypothetical protein [Pseudomonas gingeri]
MKHATQVELIHRAFALLELRDQPEAEWDFLRHSAIVYVLFPNAVLIWQGDHFEMFRFFPDEVRADRCRVQASLYCPQPALTEKARAHGTAIWNCWYAPSTRKTSPWPSRYSGDSPQPPARISCSDAMNRP